MKFKYYASIAMAALLAGCSNVEEWGQGSDSELTVALEGSASSSRAGFSTAASGNFFWTTGDKLGVTTTKLSSTFSPMTLTTGDGTGSGTFKGSLYGDVDGCYAVYPYNAGNSMNNSTLTYVFPTTYTYSAVATDFPQEHATDLADAKNNFNPAMWGKISGTSVGMKHLGGVFCVKIDKLPVGTDMKLILSADNKLNGTFTADLCATNPLLTTAETSTATEKSTSITFSNSTESASGVFYVPAPTGAFNNISVKIESSTGAELLSTVCGNYNVSRRDLKKLEINNTEVIATEAAVATDLTTAATDMATKTDVTVTGAITGTSNEITVPTNIAVTEEKPLTLSLDNVVADAKVVVKSTDSNPVPAMVLSIPTDETLTSDNALDLDIQMPNTTVTLSSNAGTATYGEVEASTADNTLIIDKGVTVNKLTVKKGNVKVLAGATVKEIVLDEGNESAIVYYEETATLPTTLPDNVTKFFYISADKNSFGEKSITDYLTDYTNVAIKLNEDITVAGFKATRYKKQNLIIDCNGYTMTLGDPTVGSTGTETNSCQLNETSKVTFKNGTLVSDNTKIMIQNYCDLTIDNMTVIGTSAQYVISNNCGTVSLNNSTVNAGSGFAFDVCGYAKYTAGVHVTATNSTVNGNVEISRSANNTEEMSLTIDGGTLNGNLSNTLSSQDKFTLTLKNNPTIKEGVTGWNKE